ncbi:glycosyltransferase, partial [Vibrio vulnificus]|nr:glycosyltransferase [Vibrio vulnificus]
NVGHVTSSEDMATLYSSCSITVVPSLTESFGQVAAESLACETPVLCFECTGLKDIVSHRVNGYLAKSYSSDELSKGIVWLANMNKDELENYGRRGRASMKKNFSAEVVTGEYIKLYSELI